MPHPQASNHVTAPRSHTRLIGDQCERCLYCHGLRITREGKRYKKLETVQLWRCHDCNRLFTPQIATGKTFPWSAPRRGRPRAYWSKGWRSAATLGLDTRRRMGYRGQYGVL